MLGEEALIWAAIAIVGTSLACAGQTRRCRPGVAATALALLAFNVFEHGFRDVVISNIGSHGSTILLALLTFAVAACDALIRGRAALLVLMMTIGSFSDRIYVIVACLPILTEAALALFRQNARPALARIVATLTALALSHGLLALNALTGGFRSTAFPITLATFSQLPDHLGFAARSLTQLLGADIAGLFQRNGPHKAAIITLLRTPFILMFFLTWFAAGAGLFRSRGRTPAHEIRHSQADLDHLLWLGMSLSVASTCVTAVIINEACIRYFLPAATMGSILVARRFGRLTLTGAYGAVVLVASLIAGLSQRSHEPPGRVIAIEQLYRITAALTAAHLQHGYAGYWEGPIVTVLSNRQVTSLSLHEGADRRLHPLIYFSNRDWYRTAARTWSGPIFFISERTDHPDMWVTPEPAILRQFGPPAERMDQGQFVIDIYDLPPGALNALAPDH